MKIEELIKNLDIPKQFLEKVLDTAKTIDFSSHQSDIRALCKAESASRAYAALLRALGEDADGVKIFTAELFAALQTYENYRNMGIDDKIYYDTMGAMRRRLYESYTEEGCWIFDRSSWAIHHISMSLFRIGALEYQLTSKYGEDVIAVHIPSDADLSNEDLDRSFADARQFFRTYYPWAGDLRIVCERWMLSQRLPKILKDGSEILNFQSRFHIEFTREGESRVRRVFRISECGLSDINMHTLPEETSLRRAIKEIYKVGGSIGEGYGIYKENEHIGALRPGKYRHYKGNMYELIGTAKHSETLENTVIYRALYADGELWVRPAYMWEQLVKTESGHIPRFEFAENDR